jgi:hypothetical protein
MASSAELWRCTTTNIKTAGICNGWLLMISATPMRCQSVCVLLVEGHAPGRIITSTILLT